MTEETMEDRNKRIERTLQDLIDRTNRLAGRVTQLERFSPRVLTEDSADNVAGIDLPDSRYLYAPLRTEGE